MSQEIEIEFKNMLTKEEFHALTDSFQLSDEAFTMQTNHYFDTKDLALCNLLTALRVRKKNDAYTLTLKQPHDDDGLLETNEPIDEEAFKAFIHDGQFPSGEIANILTELGIKLHNIKHLGEMKTNRAEISYKNGLLVFDHSFYLDTEDFELEYEVPDAKEGQAIYDELLRAYNIDVRHTDNKVRRFFNTKQAQQNQQKG